MEAHIETKRQLHMYENDWQITIMLTESEQIKNEQNLRVYYISIYNVLINLIMAIPSKYYK